MQQPLAPATIAGTPVDRYFHVCAFVKDREEEQRVIAPFVTEGIRNGERALYIVEDSLRDAHRAGLAEASPPRADDQLVVATWLETYLEEGRFSSSRMLERVETVVRESSQLGYPRVRIVGQMGWAFREHPGVESLIEYEVQVNEVLSRTRNPAICVYDVGRLSGTMMMDLLRAHPLTIVNGVLYENPFFTPPGQMLGEIRRRVPATA